MLRQAHQEDAATIARLALMLWPDNDVGELRAEFEALLASSEALILLYEEHGQALAFAQCQLRHDYVEGCSSSPVGYLEGIFVMPEHRGKGIASLLLRSCESWAREQGCSEFASDCELHNTDSLRFHTHSGFREANRIICFVKGL